MSIKKISKEQPEKFEFNSKKKLIMVGHNPGGVPEESNTTIKEDWNRHLDDLSFNALKESWGSYPEKYPGTHPIQLLYKALLDNTSLTEEDILSTNVYWKRSKSTELLKVDASLERSCKEGFMYNLEVHQPDCICFLGHASADMAGKWAKVNLTGGSYTYPWGNEQVIKFPPVKITEAIQQSVELLNRKDFENYSSIDLRIDGKIIVE